LIDLPASDYDAKVKSLRGSATRDPVCDDDPLGMMPPGYADKVLFAVAVPCVCRVYRWGIWPPDAPAPFMADAVPFELAFPGYDFVLMPKGWRIYAVCRADWERQREDRYVERLSVGFVEVTRVPPKDEQS
jgi:hypothetical protein